MDMQQESLPHESLTKQSNRNSLYSIAVVALLAVGVLGVYMPRVSNTAGSNLDTEPSGPAFVVDLDYWQKTDREKTISSTAMFDLDSDLNEIPLTVGEWTGKEVPQTNAEVQILLDPEQYVRRALPTYKWRVYLAEPYRRTQLSGIPRTRHLLRCRWMAI